MANSSKGSEEIELGYLAPPPDYELFEPPGDDFKTKLLKKTKENPFVPIGLGVTAFALTYGIYSMKSGNKALSQKMMRLRVGAQMFTVCALLGGVAYNSHKMKKKRLEADSQACVE